MQFKANRFADFLRSCIDSMRPCVWMGWVGRLLQSRSTNINTHTHAMWRLIMAYRTVTEAHAVSGLIRPLLPSGHVRPCVCVCCNECDPPAFARTWVRTNLNYTPNIDYVRMFVWCLMYVRAVSTRSKLQHTHLTAIAHAFMVANRRCRHRRLRVWSVCNDDDDGNVALTCTRMQRTQSSACFVLFFFCLERAFVRWSKTLTYMRPHKRLRNNERHANAGPKCALLLTGWLNMCELNDRD